MKDCGYCGRENVDAAIHCHECRTELNPKDDRLLPSHSSTRDAAGALRWRVVLGIVSGLQLILMFALYVMGSLLAFSFGIFGLQNGFQIGPPPEPLYSPAWDECLFLLSAILCAYHLFVAFGACGRRSFWTGAILHVGFAAVLGLCLYQARPDTWIYLLLLPGPAIWSFFAMRFRHFENPGAAPARPAQVSSTSA